MLDWISFIALIVIIILVSIMFSFNQKLIENKIYEVLIEQDPEYLLLNILRTPVEDSSTIAGLVALWCADSAAYEENLKNSISDVLDKFYGKEVPWKIETENCGDVGTVGILKRITSEPKTAAEMKVPLHYLDGSELFTNIKLNIYEEVIEEVEEKRVAAYSDEEMMKIIRLSWPLESKYKVITSGFGYRGVQKDGSDCHPGLDVGAPLNADVMAAADGIVAVVSKEYITIRHDADIPFLTRYYHVAALESITKGIGVKKGQTIAKISEWEAGNHLHFELIVENFDISGMDSGKVCKTEERKYQAVVVQAKDGLGKTDATHINPICFLEIPEESYCGESLACDARTGSLDKGCGIYQEYIIT